MKDIYNHIDNNVEEYVSDLQELIRIPSVSAQNIGLEECAEFVKKQMHKDGLPAEFMKFLGAHHLFLDILNHRCQKKHYFAILIMMFSHLNQLKMVSWWTMVRGFS